MNSDNLGKLIVSLSDIIEKYKERVIVCRMLQNIFTGKINNITNDKCDIFKRLITQPEDNASGQFGGVNDNEKILNYLFLNEIYLFKQMVFCTALHHLLLELIVILYKMNNSTNSKTSSSSRSSKHSMSSQKGGFSFTQALKAMVTTLANITMVLQSASNNSSMIIEENQTNITKIINPIENLVQNITNMTNTSTRIKPFFKSKANVTIMKLNKSTHAKSNKSTHAKSNESKLLHAKLLKKESKLK